MKPVLLHVTLPPSPPLSLSDALFSPLHRERERERERERGGGGEIVRWRDVEIHMTASKRGQRTTTAETAKMPNASMDR